MIATGGFKGRYDLHCAGRHAALTLKPAQQRVGFGDLADRFGTRDDNAGEAGMHAGSEVVVQRGGVDLRENFGAARAGGFQRGCERRPRGFAVRLDDEFGEVEHDHIGAGLRGARDEIRLGHRHQQP